jgi:hypothetical protein
MSHPRSARQLAIACICDHYTRVRSGGARLPRAATVLGLLFGKRGAGPPTVVDATDAIYEVEPGGGIAFNSEELRKKIALWTAMGEDQAFLGWYAFGAAVTAAHVGIHSLVCVCACICICICMNPPIYILHCFLFVRYGKYSNPSLLLDE